jgi:type I restriction enzyme S subunit
MRYELPLAEACERIVDCPHKTAPEADVPFAYAVGTKAINHGRIHFDKARPVDQATYETWIARATPEEEDLILCREAPVGPVARVPQYPLVCLGQRTVLLKPNRQTVDPRFLMYALLAPTTQSALRELSEGSTVAHLNVADIRRFALSIPSLDQQRRVASVLGALDDKIESNGRLASLLEETAATLFRARFIDFVGVTDLVDGEIGPIPRGWAVGSLAGLVENLRVRSLDSTAPYIGLDDMPRGSTVLSDWKTADAPRGASNVFSVGDVLLGKLRPYFHKVGVAPIDGRCSTEILVLRPIEPTWFGVVLGHVSSAQFIAHCVAVSSGTRMPRAEWKVAGDYRIAVPPAEEAARFTELVRAFYAQILNLIHESRTLAELRDTLLPKLVSGQIRVRDAEDIVEVV